jgi:hypothetical protein
MPGELGGKRRAVSFVNIPDACESAADAVAKRRRDAVVVGIVKWGADETPTDGSVGPRRSATVNVRID